MVEELIVSSWHGGAAPVAEDEVGDVGGPSRLWHGMQHDGWGSGPRRP